MWKRFTRTNWQLIFIISITTALFLPSLDNEFIGDDFDFITNWSSLHSIDSIPNLLAGDLPAPHQGNYRPVRSLIYLIMYQLFTTQILPYHVFSISVHVAITILIYFLTKALTKEKFLPFASALLFGVHPIHIEAITFVTASFDTAAYIFLLSSFLLYLKWRTTRHPILQKLSLSLAALAMGVNESAYILPLIICMYEWTIQKSNPRKIFANIKYYLGILVIFLIIRFGVVHVPNRGQYLGDSFFWAQTVSLKAIIYYLYLLIWPFHLSLVHVLPGGISTYMFVDDNSQILTSVPWFDLSLILSALFLSFSTVLILKRIQPWLAFTLGWFIIGLLPHLNFIPTAVPLSERYVYLSSLGFCWTVVWLLHQFIISSRIRNAVYIGTITVLMLVNWNYQKKWQDEVIFWKAIVEDHPQNYLVQYHYGLLLQKKYFLEESIQAFSQSSLLKPTYANPYFSKANILQYLLFFPEAVMHFTKAYELRPDIEANKINLSNSHLLYARHLLKQSKKPEAKEQLEKSLVVWPDNQEAKLMKKLEFTNQ